MEPKIGVIGPDGDRFIVAVQGDPETQQWIPRNRAQSFKQIHLEVERAKMHGEKFASLHEAWAVIFEELNEVWEITLMKRRDRDPEALRKELIQVAAMAVKAIESMESFVGGTV